MVSGNQIGVMSVGSDRYFIRGNGYAGGQSSDGVLVLASSVLIGGASDAAANVISGNAGNGVHVLGTADPQTTVTETIIRYNIIGLAPGGGYIFGTGNPGNGADGVRIDDSATNWIDHNTISSNDGAGVRLNGAAATGNAISNNVIGLRSDGKAIKGNFGEGVAVYGPQNTIGPGNVISGNLRGVGVYGPLASEIVIQNNFIGTDVTGKVDLGNAHEGVLIQDSSDDRIIGDAKGAQVISGNLVGIALSGQATTRTMVQGNFVGTDASGTAAIPNCARRRDRARLRGQLDRRNHAFGFEPDLRQPLGRPARRRGDDRQLAPEQLYRHRRLGHAAARQRGSRRDRQQLRVGQYDRRLGCVRREHHRVQLHRRRPDRVGDWQCGALEQHLSERQDRDRSVRPQRSPLGRDAEPRPPARRGRTTFSPIRP